MSCKTLKYNKRPNYFKLIVINWIKLNLNSIPHNLIYNERRSKCVIVIIVSSNKKCVI